MTGSPKPPSWLREIAGMLRHRSGWNVAGHSPARRRLSSRASRALASAYRVPSRRARDVLLRRINPSLRGDGTEFGPVSNPPQFPFRPFSIFVGVRPLVAASISASFRDDRHAPRGEIFCSAFVSPRRYAGKSWSKIGRRIPTGQSLCDPLSLKAFHFFPSSRRSRPKRLHSWPRHW